MDIVFNCTNPACNTEMAIDVAGAGSEIECPNCGRMLVVPQPTPENTQQSASAPAAAAGSKATKEEKHFAVPQRSTSDALIKKAKPSLEVAAKEADRKLRVKTIKHGECQEVGKDRFDEIVTDCVQKIGQENIVAIHPVSYSHFDVNIRQVLSDFGVVIIFKG